MQILIFIRCSPAQPREGLSEAHSPSSIIPFSQISHYKTQRFSSKWESQLVGHNRASPRGLSAAGA